MHGQHLFFATREDLRPGLEMIESRWALEYARHEMRDDTEFTRFASLLDVPGLGESQTGECMSDVGYLVYPRDARPPVRSIPQRRGGVKYDLALTPEVVQVLPGGLHVGSGALVSGRIARVVDASARGVDLYRDFSQTVLRGFNKVESYWVGPEAYRELAAGRRLAAIGIRSPRAYDLAMPSPSVADLSDTAGGFPGSR
jgi:hypothetical protein